MDDIIVRIARRSYARARVMLAGPSGSGKTFSALLMAYGLTGDWGKIAVIDSENGSAHLYSHLGGYSVVGLWKPYEPIKYLRALQKLESLGFECIIIDSLSHAWAGSGGMLAMKDKLSGKGGDERNAWRRITPIHDELIESILTSSCHIIVTVRSKTEYALVEGPNGKKTMQKVGMAPVFRDGLEYEMTIAFDVDQSHTAQTTKDRSGVFDGRFFTISQETGEELRAWLESGAPVTPDPPDVGKLRAAELNERFAARGLTRDERREFVAMCVVAGVVPHEDFRAWTGEQYIALLAALDKWTNDKVMGDESDAVDEGDAGRDGVGGEEGAAREGA